MKRLALTLAVSCALLAPMPAGASDPPPSAVKISIDWSMGDHFGRDLDFDGRIDLPNTTEYVHARTPGSCSGECPPPKFFVTLEASASVEGRPISVPAYQYEWSIDGDALSAPLHHVRTTPTLSLLLPEGDFDVDVRALIPIPWGHFTVRARGTVAVDDLLVVAIGDSYAAGEGNPEVGRGEAGGPALWADGDGETEAAHAEAHRSTVAWPARVALALEAESRHTSVTFVSVASTGARIDRGLIAPQDAGEVSQIDQVRELVGERPIDLLLLQVGGNDVGFARIIEALVNADPQLDPVCYDTMVDQALRAFADGDWRRGTALRFALPFRWTCRETFESSGLVLPGLDGLTDAFARLADQVRTLSPARTVLVPYPDPTGADPAGARCSEIVGDTLRPLGFHEVDRREEEIGVAQVLEPLNAALAAAAFRHGWDFVAGVPNVFAAGHGYCVRWPDYGYPDEYESLPGALRNRLDFPDGWYRNPGAGSPPVLVGGSDVSWYRTATQSSALQGPGVAFATSGTLHPNELGHAAIARLVLQRLAH